MQVRLDALEDNDDESDAVSASTITLLTLRL